MSSNKEFLNHILDILSDMENVTCQQVMGEYQLYYRGRHFGGVYDNKLMIKKTPAAEKLIGTPEYAIPYPGASEMLVYRDTEDAEKLMQFIEELYESLPEPKRKKRK